MTPKLKADRYIRIYGQLEELFVKTTNVSARMATMAALLHHKMPDFFWTGFYMLTNGELLVHTYQGTIACMKLKKDTGVCWAGINCKSTVIVADVEQFPGHIACSSLTKSEIVVPVKNKSGEIIGVLDIDSKKLNTFNEVDAKGLERLVELLAV